MYRKQLRHIQDMEDQKQVITRVSNYPVVKDAWNKMSEVYQRGKDGSRILRFCGVMAESSASLAYRASQPVIGKLPVGMVNDYAVTKLESLEDKYPIVVKPTEEVVDAVKTYSVAKLDEAKTYGTDKFNRLAEMTRLNAVIGVADIVVDTILPPVQPEADDEPPAKAMSIVPAEASARLYLLNDKLRRRAYDNAMAKAGTLQKRSQEAVSQLIYTVDLIELAKKNVFDVKYEQAKEKAMSVYEEITKEEEGEVDYDPPADATVERKAILSARVLAYRIRTSFAMMSTMVSALPINPTVVSNAFKSAESLYEAFMKSELSGQFTFTLLTQIRTQLSTLKEDLLDLSTSLIERTQRTYQYLVGTALYSVTVRRGDMRMRFPTAASAAVAAEDDSDSDSDDDGDVEREVDTVNVSTDDESVLD